MKILPGVSHHPFDDKVFVHSVDSQKNYLFDGAAPDVFDFIAARPNATFDELIERLAEQFDIDADEIRADIRDFVDVLIAEELIVNSARSDPKIRWSNEITKSLESYCAQRHRLFSLMIELTYRCPERCVHCYIDDFCPSQANDELTLDELKNILKQARAMGCIKILLTGGEVLMRPDLCDIVEYATALGLIVDVYTTGLGLTDEIFDRLCAAKVNSVSFSLYGGTADVHDRITGVRGSFDKTLKAMLMFRSAGVCTFIKGVAIRQNFDALDGLYRLARRLKLRISISPRIISGHRSKRAEDYRLSADQYRQFFELEARYDEHDFFEPQPQSREEVMDSAPCSAGRNGLSLNPYGEARACSRMKNFLGSLRAESLEKIWERAGKQKYLEHFTLRELTPRCPTCKYVGHCQPCVAELSERGTNDCGDMLLRARAADIVKHNLLERW